MKTEPRRYQLQKEAARVVSSGHPWLFRSHLGTASESFGEGDWVRLFDGENKVLGYGRYAREGLVAVRVFRRGPEAPSPNWFAAQVDRALARRKNLRGYSTGFRAIHGENDGLPGIVIDIYGDVGVLQTYSSAVDAVGRYVAALVRQRLSLRGVLWKMPAKRQGGSTGDRTVRVLWGTVPDEISWTEGKAQYWVSLASGQKSGAFLDLRALRKWLQLANLRGARLLNLFSYTGTLALAAEMGGAKEIISVDVAEPALAFAKRRHTINASKHRFVAADIFNWLPNWNPNERFDGVIVDPPQVASETRQVPLALATYKKLYRAASARVKPGGWLIGACCTARITASQFEASAMAGLGQQFRIEKRLGSEDDHPVTFAEGAYLKIVLFRRLQ